MLLACATACARGPTPIALEEPKPGQPWTPVIVQLRLPPFETEEQKLASITRIREALLTELRSTPYRVTRAYETIPAVALEVSAEALRVLETSRLVASIGKDTVSVPNQR
jgi:hypothetical protein